MANIERRKTGAFAAALLNWRWAGAALGVFVAATLVAFLQEPLPVPVDRSAQPFSFWHPIERNPHRRLQATSANLTYLHFDAEGRRGWAVGGDGTVLETSNGGERWGARETRIPHQFNALTFDEQGRRWWTAGNGGVVSSSTDEGRTWTSQTIHDADLRGIAAGADGTSVWVVGNGGALLRSIDGGRTWPKARLAEGGDLERVWNLSEIAFDKSGQIGWAGGPFAPLLRSSDSGQTWTFDKNVSVAIRSVSVAPDGSPWVIRSGTGDLMIGDGPPQQGPQSQVQSQLGALRVVELRAAAGTLEALSLTLSKVALDGTGRRGVAVGDLGSFFTENGGRSWEARSPYRGASASTAVHRGERVWLAGARGSIAFSPDRGRTWQAQTAGAQVARHALAFADDGELGWSVGASGLVMRTDDGGRSWRALPVATTSRLRGVTTTPDGRRAWAVGVDGAIVSGTQAAAWTVQRNPSGVQLPFLLAVTFDAEARSGWAVGLGSEFLHTTNGGATWQTVSPSPSSGRATSRAIAFDARFLRGVVARESSDPLLTTEDGGGSWKSVAGDDPKAGFNAVAVRPDGRAAWAVGERGSIRLWQEGHTDWTAKESGTQDDLIAVRFDPSGQHGVAQGRREAVRSADGGHTWKAIAAGAPDLVTASFDKSLDRGWAVSRSGLLVRSSDGGRTWRPGERYARFPGLWYWLAVALAALLLWTAWLRRPKADPRESVADVVASDSEVRHPSDDRLQFAGLARGISRFLRNPETRPPLTLAVTGDWGSGKSSLMRLVCADLGRFGYRPIWFNAWHHQKQEHLFAALLGAVKSQAAPGAWSPLGLVFRLRLLWIRSRRNFALTMVVVAAVSALVTASRVHSPDEMLDAMGNLSKALETATTPAKSGASGATATAATAGREQPPVLPGLAQLTAFLVTVTALLKGTRAIGVDPAVLLAGIREGGSVRTAGVQNDLRAQFAQQFKDVTCALPYRMVIVIDDLDRCRPDSVLEVMETVNYLTSAGECFVIFGMASERVQAALALAFKDIASELVHVEEPASAEPMTPEEAQRAKRRAYAADYLQKLINIEIKVPTRRDMAMHGLLVHDEPDTRSGLFRTVRQIAAAWPVGAVAAAAFIGVWLAAQSGPSSIQKPASRPAVLSEASQPASSPAASPAPVVPPIAEKTQSSDRPTIVIAGESGTWTDHSGWLALGFAPIALTALLILYNLLRKTATETRDSRQFRDALRIWTPVVAAKRFTPRAVKRFGNRIRYLAMLQQGESSDETPLDVLLRRMAALLRRQPEADEAAVHHGAVAEHQLIAMGALHEIGQAHWREILRETQPDGDEGGDEGLELPQEVTHQLFEAMAKHESAFAVEWPPSDEELAVFERLLAGVRMPGDPVTVTGAARADMPAPGPRKAKAKKMALGPSPPAESRAETAAE